MSDRPAPNDARTVTIPEPLCERLEARLAGTEFDSVDDYATYALTSLLHHLEHSRGEGVLDPTERSAETETAAVRDRLESLGYL